MAGSHLRRSLLALSSAFALTAGAAPAGGEEVSREYQLKAAFVFNFTRFTEWPAESFAEADSPIVIAVLGRNPFGGELARIVAARSVNGRRLEVVTVQRLADAGDVHLLFVSTADAGELSALFAELAGRPVLTVGESAAFAGHGGMIRLAVRDDRVTFAISAAAVERAGLRVSAQLQKLATTITSSR